MTATGEWTGAEKRIFFFSFFLRTWNHRSRAVGSRDQFFFTQPAEAAAILFLVGSSEVAPAAVAERPLVAAWLGLVVTSPSLRARRLAVKGGAVFPGVGAPTTPGCFRPG